MSEYPPTAASCHRRRRWVGPGWFSMAAVQSGVFTSHQKVRGFESHRTITPSGPFRGSV